jgi:outer membrane protein assembly factor BamB
MGGELWRAAGLSGDVAPSAAYADGKAFVTNEYSCLMAIRADGSGDVSNTHVAWKADEGMSDASSPVCNPEFFLQAHSSGQVTCYDAKEGKLLWTKELQAGVWASPSLVGNLVYLPDEKGKMHIFELANPSRDIAAPDLAEAVYASPAFGGSQIYVRTVKHLFCIGHKRP